MKKSAKLNITAFIFAIGGVIAIMAAYWWIFVPYQRLYMKEKPAKVIPKIFIEPEIACSDIDSCVITDQKNGLKLLTPSTGHLQYFPVKYPYFRCGMSPDGKYAISVSRGIVDLAELTGVNVNIRRLYTYPKKSEGEMPVSCFLTPGNGAVFGANLVRFAIVDQV